MERRKFLNSMIRWSLFGSLATMSGFILRHRSNGFHATCSFNPACRECNRYNSCEKVVKTNTSKNGE